MIAVGDPFKDTAPASGELGPTRTQRTKEATAVNELGLQIATLSPDVLDLLDLPERLREAIDVCQVLKLRARSRQKRLICRLLREEDHEAIRSRVESLTEGPAGNQQESLPERWLSRLVEEGDPAVEALIAAHPDADRQRLRLLVRTARRAPQAKKAKKARQKLLLAIHDLRR